MQLMGTTPDTLDEALLRCSAGIMAHNEAGNIRHAIDAILQQRLTVGRIEELIVVASGCTDATPEIVADMARGDPRVHLIIQERREGKASAINLWLSAARAPILLLVSADVLFKEGTLDVLLGHFRDPTVGMVGAHPIPVNDESTFLGYAVHLLWQLHDVVARATPKLGESIAFRNVIPSIPFDTAVDEISIQAVIGQLGYKLIYEPRAIVFNRGPANVSDFLKQRRRIHAGHLRWRQQHGYSAATMSIWRVGRALLAAHPFTSQRATRWTLGTVALEALGRLLGTYDHARRRTHHVWPVAATTKSHIADAAAAHSQQSVLVFHIIGFHQQVLELGTRASQLLVQQVAEQLRQALGPGTSISAERGGTIIALVPVERAEAERAAQAFIGTIQSAPLRFDRHRDAVALKLGCGIIAFLQTGQADVLSIPAV
jgi:biofilm PGA synthesis N-glycosyltransferase PgaC